MLGMSMMAPLGLWYSWGLIQTKLAVSFFSFLHKPVEFIQRTLAVFGIWLKNAPGSSAWSSDCASAAARRSARPPRPPRAWASNPCA